MRILPLIQSKLFDVADWERDSEFGVFPQGARAKDAVFAPAVADKVIVPGKRYLFKRSKKSYPDQFWGEVIAYRVGCLLGVEVPPAFAAWNSKSQYCAALIEWFYIDGKESLIMGGDFLQGLRSDFDRKQGKQHNMADNIRLMRRLAKEKYLKTGWRQWWVDALLFDALIGNNDRHQDNWGLVFHRIPYTHSCRLTPLFDNGTSLGHERFPEHIQNWKNADYDRYIRKGTHHVKWSLSDEPPINGHLELLQRVLTEWPETQRIASARLNFTQDDMSGCLVDLPMIDAPIRLSSERIAFVLRLLFRRHELLKSLFL